MQVLNSINKKHSASDLSTYSSKKKLKARNEASMSLQAIEVLLIHLLSLRHKLPHI